MRRMYSENQLDSIIKEQVEGGTLENAKPIYCHPIQITFIDNKGLITMLIFNNDATPFTASTFIDWLDNLYQEVGDYIRIMTSGAIIGTNSNALCPACYLVRRTSSLPYGVLGVKSDGSADSYDFLDKATFIASCSTFNDGVNKIN